MFYWYGHSLVEALGVATDPSGAKVVVLRVKDQLELVLLGEFTPERYVLTESTSRREPSVDTHFVDREGRVFGVEGKARDTGGTCVTVLRGADNRICIVSSEALRSEGYQPVIPSNLSIDLGKEVLSNIRQNSTLRFAAVPVFFTAFGVLAKYYYSNDLTVPQIGIAVAGLCVALWFACVEVLLSRNLIRWWRSIQAAGPLWKPVRRHRTGECQLTLQRFALFAPYPTAAGFWLYQLVPCCIVCVIGGGGMLLGLAYWSWERAKTG